MTDSMSLGDVVKLAYDLFSPLEAADRTRALQGLLALFPEDTTSTPLRTPATEPQPTPALAGSTQPESSPADAKAYFDLKQPNTKIEELAVAARFREEHHRADRHSKEDLK
ncbi:MAG: hypothetical protein V2J24_18395, partial [Pseudomonadales bacterium]|nr:hypothetical protein [Pseudomonadales bacterium]